MATYYVSQRSGSDSGPGTDPASPFKTLSFAFYRLGNTTTANTIIINDSATYFVTQSSAPGSGLTNDTNQIIGTTHHLVSNLTITTGSEPNGTGCKPIFDGDGGAAANSGRAGGARRRQSRRSEGEALRGGSAPQHPAARI